MILVANSLWLYKNSRDAWETGQSSLHLSSLSFSPALIQTEWCREARGYVQVINNITVLGLASGLSVCKAFAFFWAEHGEWLLYPAQQREVMFQVWDWEGGSSAMNISNWSQRAEPAPEMIATMNLMVCGQPRPGQWTVLKWVRLARLWNGDILLLAHTEHPLRIMGSKAERNSRNNGREWKPETFQYHKYQLTRTSGILGKFQFHEKSYR